MLPVEPGVSEFVGEYIPPPCDGESFADVDGLGLIVPNPIRIRILPVHFRVCDLPDHDVIAEWKDDFVWYSHHALTVVSMGGLNLEFLFLDSLTYFLFRLPI
jgi:hypothetical protein